MAVLDHEPPKESSTPALPVEPTVGNRAYRLVLSDQNVIDIVAALRYMELRLQMNHHPRRASFTALATKFASLTEYRRPQSLAALGMEPVAVATNA